MFFQFTGGSKVFKIVGQFSVKKFSLICYIEELKRRGLTYIKGAIMINKNNSKQNYTVKKSNNIKELSNNEEIKIVAQA